MMPSKDEELEAFISDTCPSAVFIGTETTRRGYFQAIVGLDTNNGRIIYSRSRLVEAFMQEDMSEEDAAEWISYNIDRSLPYMGEHAPIIMDELEDVGISDTRRASDS